MSIIAEVLGWIGGVAIVIISSLGYFGVFFLMILESMVIPLPSELVMPFAGFLAATGEFSLFWVIVMSTLGSLVGSLISYGMGLYGGYPLLKRYGKYFLVDVQDLEETKHWFSKKGDITILVGRFIPVVRHLISIPAGISKMNLFRFCFYTTLGALIWNSILAVFGFYLGQNWHAVRDHTEIFSYIVLAFIVVGAVWFIYSHILKKKMKTRFRKNK